MDSADIRERFLAFFTDRGHERVASASTVAEDPTLLLTNAGMAPFKPYFLGQIAPPFKRATSVQKCVRTPDIEVVGTTSRHVTFFEMAGNFSFGDYFKEQAIPFAWDLLTKSPADGGYGFEESRLWATVFTDDDEAEHLWTNVVGVPKERVQRRGMADNFWSMGVPGPCGPCSEIYYDRGPDYGRDGGPVADEERYLEIWNLVFMQFERGAGAGKDDFPIVGDLPAKNIDTGLGVDRVAILKQGVDNIFQTDLLSGTLDRVAELTGKRLGQDARNDVSLRVVADHTRTATFLIGDGVTPSNEGRGYVLRRLLRRAVRNMRLLGAREPVMTELVATVADAMGPAYPELVTDLGRIGQVARTEEMSFLRTLDEGSQRFAVAVSELKGGPSRTLPGDVAFRLHDTYGFPIDLTLEMAGEQGLDVDEERFRALMAEQKARSKDDRKGKAIGNADVSVYGELLAGGETTFTGYEELTTEARVRGLLRDGELISGATEGDVVELVLDRTPFYAESGGQSPDAGRITGPGGLELEVLDVQKRVKKLIGHTVRVVSGELATGATVLAAVDPDWRLGACQAHSGTHVMHAALRQVLGPTALQSGSYNKPGYLRLDFAWPEGLSRSTRSEVEEVANLAVRRDLPVRALLLSLADARAFGALALFGETYDESAVRVVEVGGPWSRELCGGTHVAHSSQIGPLVLTGESSVGSGVRRVEALVGIEGFHGLVRDRELVAGLSELLKTPSDGLADRVAGLVARIRDLEREAAAQQARAAASIAGDLAQSPRDVFGVAFVAHRAPDGTPGDVLRTLALDVRGRLGAGPAVVALAAAVDGRVQLVVAANEVAQQWRISAGDLVKVGALLVGGNGGGKPDVAQGGGTDPSRIAEALTAIEHAVGARATGGT